jgi:hypothetical protein
VTGRELAIHDDHGELCHSVDSKIHSLQRGARGRNSCCLRAEERPRRPRCRQAEERRSMGVHPMAVMGEGSTGKQRMSSGSGEQGAEEQRRIAPTGGGVASKASRASQTSYNELMIRVFQNN